MSQHHHKSVLISAIVTLIIRCKFDYAKSSWNINCQNCESDLQQNQSFDIFFDVIIAIKFFVYFFGEKKVIKFSDWMVSVGVEASENVVFLFIQSDVYCLHWKVSKTFLHIKQLICGKEEKNLVWIQMKKSFIDI